VPLSGALLVFFKMTHSKTGGANRMASEKRRKGNYFT
jgi:hypothetical protein